MGHPTMQENDTAKLTPTNKHISLLFFRIYMKNTINMLDDIDNIASYVDAFKWISYSSFR